MSPPFSAPWYEQALYAAQIALWDVDLASGRLSFSEGWSVMMGLPATTMITTVAEFERGMHAEDLPEHRRVSRDTILGRRPSYSLEHRILRADGRYMWILSRGRVTERDPASGHARRMSGTSVDITASRSGLTDRELEVLHLLGSGLSGAEIAAKLRRSRKTIDVHRQNIKNKLQLKSSADLVRFAARWDAEG